MVNRGQIRGLVRTFINEATEGFWLDSELNTAINIASQKLNSLIRFIWPDFFMTPKTFATTTNTKSYAWPQDFAGLRRLERYSTSDPAKDIVVIKQLVWPQTEGPELDTSWPYSKPGKPEVYVPFGDHFDLLPIPDAAYPIRIYFDQIKADLTQDTSSPSSPAEYHDMVAIWATMLILPKNHEDPSYFAGLWEMREADMARDLRQRQAAGPLLMSIGMPVSTVEDFL